VIYYKMGFTPEEIAAKFGHLMLAQVHAALAYYHANHETVEADIAAEEAEAERLERDAHLARHGESDSQEIQTQVKCG
jgi:uncharacterized protein YaiL (DUF2058 family)